MLGKRKSGKIWCEHPRLCAKIPMESCSFTTDVNGHTLKIPAPLVVH